MRKPDKKELETTGARVVFVINRVVDWIFIVFFLLVLLFCLYAIYDSAMVYEEASSSGKVKEFVLEEDNDGRRKIDFDSLLAVSKDVMGWIVLDGTNVDQMVLHGDDNNFYLSHSYGGKYAIAGSAFMDSQNSRDWNDAYILIFGHNMNDDLMFGQLRRYHEKDFFDEHQTGMLYTPHGDYKLRVEAELIVNKDAGEIYSVTQSRKDATPFLNYVNTHADQKRGTLDPSRKYVALSTCQGQTNMRQVVVVGYDPNAKL
jgi:sortase B